jgi:4a-hydroxytetrahydrobiopterin dehydratase
MGRMSAVEIRAAMATVEGWTRKGQRLTREFCLDDFAGAIRFVGRVARAAEEAWHHPDIDIRWNRVRLSLTTHDEGGLTERDFVLAARFNQIASGRRRRP